MRGGRGAGQGESLKQRERDRVVVGQGRQVEEKRQKTAKETVSLSAFLPHGSILLLHNYPHTPGD